MAAGPHQYPVSWTWYSTERTCSPWVRTSVVRRVGKAPRVRPTTSVSTWMPFGWAGLGGSGATWLPPGAAARAVPVCRRAPVAPRARAVANDLLRMGGPSVVGGRPWGDAKVMSMTRVDP